MSGGTVGQGDTLVGMQRGTSEMEAEYQNLCYHIGIVHVKINLQVIEGEEDSLGERWGIAGRGSGIGGWMDGNFAKSEQVSASFNPPARVDGQVKSPALQNRGQGTQLHFRTYCPDWIRTKAPFRTRVICSWRTKKPGKEKGAFDDAYWMRLSPQLATDFLV
jgi:hypothetical protein